MSYAKKLPVGSLGICNTAIANGAWGEASIHSIPPQAKGQWDLGTYRVHALENIRENRDIIIVSANNGAIEHTPQELKYMTRAETWQRVDEDHPLPVSQTHQKWAFKEYTALATRDDIAVGLTAPHNLTPDSDKTLIVYDILLFANAASNVTIEGGDGTNFYIIYRAYLPAGGGSNVFDLGVTLRGGHKIYVTVSAPSVSVTITADQK